MLNRATVRAVLAPNAPVGGASRRCATRRRGRAGAPARAMLPSCHLPPWNCVHASAIVPSRNAPEVLRPVVPMERNVHGRVSHRAFLPASARQPRRFVGRALRISRSGSILRECKSGEARRSLLESVGQRQYALIESVGQRVASAESGCTLLSTLSTLCLRAERAQTLLLRASASDQKNAAAIAHDGVQEARSKQWYGFSPWLAPARRYSRRSWLALCLG